MNIIVDEATSTALTPFILSTIEFGSAMKGTSTPKSDHDYLHIIKPSWAWLASPVDTNHLLQFRAENGDDHIYCTPQTFVKGLIDGDAAIFHEMWRYGALKGTCLHDLQGLDFNHYKTMRAYLGLAKRDLKEACKLFSKDNRKAVKKFKFALEAYNYVGGILGRTDSVNYAPALSALEMRANCMSMTDHVAHMRIELNHALESGEICQTVDKFTLQKLGSFVDPFRFDAKGYTTGLEYFYDSHINGN